MTNDEILARLKALEADKNIRIIYACESGSRAWGFPSPDSDYDIRFLYVRPINDYLRVFPGKDVIALPIDGDSDMGGWDMRKAFALLRKSNSALIEWLSSPIIYRQQSGAIQLLKDIVETSFLAGSACHHYISLAKKKIDEIESQDEVKLKSYFYALRATLCANYIVEQGKPPPMRIDSLVATYLPVKLQSSYAEILTRKMNCVELQRECRQDWLDLFLREKVSSLSESIPVNQKRQSTELYDRAFRECLNLVWA